MSELPLKPGRRWFQKGRHVAMNMLEADPEGILDDILARAVREIQLEMRVNGYEPEGDYEVFVRVTRAGMPRERRGQEVST